MKLNGENAAAEEGIGHYVMTVLDVAAELNAPLTVRFACLTLELGMIDTTVNESAGEVCLNEDNARLIREVSERLRVPNDCRELAVIVAREREIVHRSAELDASGLTQLLERCNALKRPERFAELLLACECDARARPGLENRPYPPKVLLTQALLVAKKVNSNAVSVEAAVRGLRGAAIGEAVHQARVKAVAEALFANLQ